MAGEVLDLGDIATREAVLTDPATMVTGRLHRMTIYPFSQGELEGTKVNLLSSLFDQPAATVAGRPSTTPREEYTERIARGGFPPVS